eukprot:7064032-Pyramimonas_sp.AAC.1
MSRFGTACPPWFTAFLRRGAVCWPGTTWKKPTSQMNEIGGRVAAVEVKFEELQAKQRDTDKILHVATTSSAASTSMGHKRPRAMGT